MVTDNPSPDAKPIYIDPSIREMVGLIFKRRTHSRMMLIAIIRLIINNVEDPIKTPFIKNPTSLV